MNPNQHENGAERLLDSANSENEGIQRAWLSPIKLAIETLVRRAETLNLRLAAVPVKDSDGLNFAQLRSNFIRIQAGLAVALHDRFPDLSKEARTAILMKDSVLSEALGFSFRIGPDGGSIDWTKIKMNGQEFQEKIGEGIAAIRDKQHLTQAELAKRIGMTHSSIARLEAGTQRLGMSVLYKIAEAMQVSPAVFLPKEAFPPERPTGRISPETISRVRSSLPELPKVFERVLDRYEKTARKGRK